MAQIGDEILDGKAIVASVDAQGKILSIQFPGIRDDVNQPLTITFNYGQTVAQVMLIADAIVQ